MSQKKLRHAKIIELVTNHAIETQDELQSMLNAAGFLATQATVSRDMRDLGIFKVSDGRGGHCYAVHKTGDGVHVHIQHALADAILQIERVNNLLVLHTLAGMAQAIAAEVDKLRERVPAIVGCVAGDDTILVVIREEEQAKSLHEELRSLIRSQEQEKRAGGR